MHKKGEVMSQTAEIIENVCCLASVLKGTAASLFLFVPKRQCQIFFTTLAP